MTGKLIYDHPMTVTLTGAEWTAIAAYLANKSLSPIGMEVFGKASRKLQAQLLAQTDSAPDAP